MSSLDQSLRNLHSVFGRLHGLIGSEINGLDANYMKGINVKPIVPKTPRKLKTKSLLDQMVGSLPGLFGKVISSAGSSLMEDSGMDFGGFGGSDSDFSAGGLSQNQIWSKVASGVS